jgi:glycosyltransferase involved in cell wall biosynthesis
MALRPRRRRLRIVLHGRCLQDASATRGVGRYAAGLLRGLRSCGDPELELGVALDETLPAPRKPPDAADDGTWLGFPMHPVPLDVAGESWLRRGGRLNRALRVFGGDLLHIPAQYYLERVARIGVPYVVTVHDLIPHHFPPPHRHPQRLARRRQRIARACRRARAVIADSEHTRDECVRHLGVRPDRVAVIPLGVDAWFEPVDRGDDAVLRRLGVRTPYFLYVGADDLHKNLAGLFQAFTACAGGAVRGHELVAAGPFQRRAELPPPAGVRTLGHVDDADLPALYRRATAFVTLSLHEGFGLPALEAMACGAPVVAAANTALLETVGDAGLLVDARDPRAAAGALRAVAGDPQLAARLRERGLKRAALHTWERSAQRLLETYRRALRRRV